jgi:BirA family biotin operon repressor/biotin-[acetyl-CoA-carboxylase] ligase
MLIGHKVIVKDEVPSTNQLAKGMAADGEAEGTVVVASTQTAGRGRLGRSWASPPGGLYMSIILRPDGGAALLTRLTVFSCLPVAQAVEDAYGLKAQVKWPNDVMAAGLKVGGILAEGVSIAGRQESVVLGIGVNLNTRHEELGLASATSLRALTGKEVARDAFLHTLLFRLDAFYGALIKGELDTDAYRSRCVTLGRTVEARLGDQAVEGRAIYVEDGGALVIKTEDGMTYSLNSAYETTMREEQVQESFRQKPFLNEAR